MQKFLLALLFSFFLIQPVFANLNTDKAIIEHSQKIKKLTQKNRDLKGEIEQLAQQQQEINKKIKELFGLIVYKKTSNKVDKFIKDTQKLDKNAKKIYTDARSLLVSEQYDKAIILFKKYLDTYPDNNNTADVHYWLAKTYLANKNYKQAKNTFFIFQKHSPLHHKNPNAVYELSKIYIALKQPQKAKDSLNNILKKFPTHKIANQAKQLLSTIKPNAN